MSFATRFASLGGTRGLATALALLVSAPVLAQTAPAQRRPLRQPSPRRPAAPAQQPAPRRRSRSSRMPAPRSCR